MTPMHDFEMTHRYFRLLSGGEDELMTFQVFDDSKKNAKRAKWSHLKCSDASIQHLAKLQANGAGVFVMVNRGDGKGRKAENVVEVRALFIDLDGSPWEPAANMLKPHIMVESSPGRYHLYWLVSDCTLDQFKPLQQAIAMQYDGDKSCVDLPRVLRVPGFLHQKHEPVLTKLIEANDFPKYTTQQVTEGLQLGPESVPEDDQQPGSERSTPRTYEYIDPASGEVIDLVVWAAQNPDFNIVAALNPFYRRGKIVGGKQHITCPMESEHTEHGLDLATFIANACPPQHNAWDIHCMHSHCAGRDRLDFFQAMLENGWINTDQLLAASPAIKIKRPPRIYFPNDDILADPAWSALQRDERGVAFEIMIMAWTQIDGMIADDDWMIARRLGVPKEEWLIIRENLFRVGWLVENQGKLTNPIVKREFDKAQKAYMAFNAKSGNGGRKTQENKRSQAPA